MLHWRGLAERGTGQLSWTLQGMALRSSWRLVVESKSALLWTVRAGSRSWSNGRKAGVFSQPRTLGKWAWFQEEGRNSQRVLLPEVRPMVYKAPVMRLSQRQRQGAKNGSMGQRTTRNIFRWLEETSVQKEPLAWSPMISIHPCVSV